MLRSSNSSFTVGLPNANTDGMRDISKSSSSNVTMDSTRDNKGSNVIIEEGKWPKKKSNETQKEAKNDAKRTSQSFSSKSLEQRLQGKPRQIFRSEKAIVDKKKEAQLRGRVSVKLESDLRILHKLYNMQNKAECKKPFEQIVFRGTLNLNLPFAATNRSLPKEPHRISIADHSIYSKNLRKICRTFNQPQRGSLPLIHLKALPPEELILTTPLKHLDSASEAKVTATEDAFRVHKGMPEAQTASTKMIFKEEHKKHLSATSFIPLLTASTPQPNEKHDLAKIATKSDKDFVIPKVRKTDVKSKAPEIISLKKLLNLRNKYSLLMQNKVGLVASNKKASREDEKKNKKFRTVEAVTDSKGCLPKAADIPEKLQPMVEVALESIEKWSDYRGESDNSMEKVQKSVYLSAVNLSAVNGRNCIFRKKFAPQKWYKEFLESDAFNLKQLSQDVLIHKFERHDDYCKPIKEEFVKEEEEEEEEGEEQEQEQEEEKEKEKEEEEEEEREEEKEEEKEEDEKKREKNELNGEREIKRRENGDEKNEKREELKKIKLKKKEKKGIENEKFSTQVCDSSEGLKDRPVEEEKGKKSGEVAPLNERCLRKRTKKNYQDFYLLDLYEKSRRMEWKLNESLLADELEDGDAYHCKSRGEKLLISGNKKKSFFKSHLNGFMSQPLRATKQQGKFSHFRAFNNTHLRRRRLGFIYKLLRMNRIRLTRQSVLLSKRKKYLRRRSYPGRNFEGCKEVNCVKKKRKRIDLVSKSSRVMNGYGGKHDSVKNRCGKISVEVKNENADGNSGLERGSHDEKDNPKLKSCKTSKNKVKRRKQHAKTQGTFY